jgi:carbon monoxide dehydrogenase subunit G
MSNFKIQENYESSADAVWKLLGDFGGIADWMPGIESCEVSGEGVGAVRKIAMPGGANVEETLEAHDEGARSLSYSIGEGPLPVQDYLATITVNEEGSGCSVDWTAKFGLPEGIPDEPILQALEAAYGGALVALKKKVGG